MPDWWACGLTMRCWTNRISTCCCCDELIDPASLAQSERPFIAAVGRSCQRYRELLQERNALDFAHLQAWAHRVLQHGDIAAKVSGAIRHLMVDEFQDTSRIQLRILDMLAQMHGNIVVVGDDDQSIYRFRGASVANLLEFPGQYPDCSVAELTTNYRSHPDIVAACRAWMDTAADWSNPLDADRPFRYAKDLAAQAPEDHPAYPAVISVQGAGLRDEVRQLGGLLRFLRDNGVIAGYGRVALLLHSVKDAVSGPYLDGLEAAGIPARCEPAGQARVFSGDDVLITTIHQAKGREWDVVIAGSLTAPDQDTDRVGRNLGGSCSGTNPEPGDRIGEFDRVRRHYVAFTRARNLLVLTASGMPQPRFRSIWESASHWPEEVDQESLARQRFAVPGEGPPQDAVEIGHLDRLVIRLEPPQRV